MPPIPAMIPIKHPINDCFSISNIQGDTREVYEDSFNPGAVVETYVSHPYQAHIVHKNSCYLYKQRMKSENKLLFNRHYGYPEREARRKAYTLMAQQFGING